VLIFAVIAMIHKHQMDYAFRQIGAGVAAAA
jgi:hypothetical protein